MSDYTTDDLPALQEQLANTQNPWWDRLRFALAKGLPAPLAAGLTAARTPRQVLEQQIGDLKAAQDTGNKNALATSEVAQRSATARSHNVQSQDLENELPSRAMNAAIGGTYNLGRATGGDVGQAREIGSRYNFNPITVRKPVPDNPAEFMDTLIAPPPEPEKPERPITLHEGEAAYDTKGNPIVERPAREGKEPLDNARYSQFKRFQSDQPDLSYEEQVKGFNQIMGRAEGSDYLAEALREFGGGGKTPASAPGKKPSSVAAPATAGKGTSPAIASLKQKAKDGDAKAQSYLKQKGIAY